MAGGVVLRGVEANCAKCGQKQWRPLSEAVPALTCHGCGRKIDNPHGFNHIEYAP
jgi:ribosomal protein S27E